MTDVYGLNKALWHWDQMAQLKRSQQPYPVHVQLIISDHCNSACPWCSYRTKGYSSNQLFADGENVNPNRMIPDTKCWEILDDCAEMGVKAIQFTGGGEPTIHPHFWDIASYALDKGFAVSLVTNGTMLKHEHIREVVRRMAWVRVSVDASNHMTYTQLRKVHYRHWCAMEDGICMLVAEKARDKLPLVIGAGFVCTPDNWREMYDACGLFQKWGVDNVRLGLMFSQDNAKPYEPFENEMLALARHTVEHYNADGFTVISRVAEKLDELKQGHPRYPDCWYQHFTTYIGGDQNVYRCCVYSYNKRGLIGSLKGRRFKDLWDSSEKTAAFSDFDARGCERCQFNAINANIDYALKGKTAPTHVEFV